jgi:hypothetical protein
MFPFALVPGAPGVALLHAASAIMKANRDIQIISFFTEMPTPSNHKAICRNSSSFRSFSAPFPSAHQKD